MVHRLHLAWLCGQRIPRMLVCLVIKVVHPYEASLRGKVLL